jgi:calcineurin-like phosphoesterase family protein
MRKIWVISDLHFCHNRDFIYGKRGFESIAEHDEAIIKNWNKLVSAEDDVYILGDSMLNDNVAGCACLRRLAGHKHMLIGNHDSRERVAQYEQLFNTDVLGCAYTMKYKGYTLYLSHYPTLTDNHDGDKPLNRRVINLCGHTHTTDRWSDFDKGLIYHVDVDAHDMKPTLLDDIIEEIKEKVNE